MESRINNAHSWLQRLQVFTIATAFTWLTFQFYARFAWDPQSYLEELRIGIFAVTSMVVILISLRLVLGELRQLVVMLGIAALVAGAAYNVHRFVTHFSSSPWVEEGRLRLTVRPSWLSYAQKSPHLKIRANLSRFIFLHKYLAGSTLIAPPPESEELAESNILFLPFLNGVTGIAELRSEKHPVVLTEMQAARLLEGTWSDVFQPTDRSGVPSDKQLRVVLTDPSTRTERFYYLQSPTEHLFVAASLYEKLRLSDGAGAVDGAGEGETL